MAGMAYHGYIPFIKEFIRPLSTPSVLEVGLDKGQTMLPLIAWMVRETQSSVYVGIDVMLQDSLGETMKYMDVDGKRHRAFVCVGNSMSIMPDFVQREMRFDVILLDGDHNYHTVSTELSYIDALLEPGGIVIIDDYHGRWSDKDLWYSERPGWENAKDATKRVDTEKHGVKAAVDDFVAANAGWRLVAAIDGGEPVVMTRVA